MIRIDLQGESLELLPERALFWERTATLVVADAHLGKAASFRAAALPMPGGTTTGTLSRLSLALSRTGARRLLILGDFFHARSGRAARTLAVIAEWRERHAGLGVVLVRGNHDRGAGDPPCEWGFACCDEPWVEPPFAFRHHPAEEASGYVLAGHVHPAVSLAGPGRQRERLSCFLFGERIGLLPAFGDFTGGATVRPRPGDRVYGVAGDEVVPIRTG
ncbi:MAG TPA: ligase-associated DNA damage response endonuclease PdeM [Thermoanaerobaculia bacterium]